MNGTILPSQLRVSKLDIVDSKIHIQPSSHPNRRPASDRIDTGLRSACSAMESLFINYLLKEMRVTIDKSGFISGGRAEEIYTSLMDYELAQKISDRKGIGLADILFKQLSSQYVQTTEGKAD
jgi:flagellar protein FlgJ